MRIDGKTQGGDGEANLLFPAVATYVDRLLAYCTFTLTGPGAIVSSAFFHSPFYRLYRL
jgi:hypothetical protein